MVRFTVSQLLPQPFQQQVEGSEIPVQDMTECKNCGRPRGYNPERPDSCPIDEASNT